MRQHIAAVHHIALIENRRDDAAQPPDALHLIGALAHFARHLVHIGRAVVLRIVAAEFHVGAEEQIAEPRVRRNHRIGVMLGDVQRGVGRFLRHVIDVDQQAAPHHLLQQDEAVFVEAAHIGMAAANRGAFQRFKQIAHGRNLAQQRLMRHVSAASKANRRRRPRRAAHRRAHPRHHDRAGSGRRSQRHFPRRNGCRSQKC